MSELKPVRATMIQQFNKLAEQRKKAKDRKTDLKAMRPQGREWDSKNRKP